MQENTAVIGALIFIGLVVGANLVMYAIARGATRSGGGGLLDMLAKSLTANPSKKKDEMEELRRSVRELTGEKTDKNPE